MSINSPWCYTPLCGQNKGYKNQGWRLFILLRVLISLLYLEQRFFWLRRLSPVFYLLFLFTFSIPVYSAVIRFPEQELASEYVFPVFKNPKAVLNRNVTLSKRFEFRVSSVFRTDEPFYNRFSLLASLSFYWSESHGIGVSGLYFFPGLSSTGTQLKERGVKDKRTKEVEYFDANLAPYPFLGGFLNYQFSPLYGKISITKTLVFNFSVYSFFGLGVLGLKHGASIIRVVPASHFGVGQRLYFGRYFAIDIGIGFLVYFGPNPADKAIKWTASENTPRRPSYNTFEKDIFFRFLPRGGMTLLF